MTLEKYESLATNEENVFTTNEIPNPEAKELASLFHGRRYECWNMPQKIITGVALGVALGALGIIAISYGCHQANDKGGRIACYVLAAGYGGIGVTALIAIGCAAACLCVPNKRECVQIGKSCQETYQECTDIENINNCLSPILDTCCPKSKEVDNEENDGVENV